MIRKIGAACHDAGRAANLVTLTMPEVPAGGAQTSVIFAYRIDRQALRQCRRRDGRRLLRSNMLDRSPGDLWEFYRRLVEVEAAFRTLKGDLALRPIFHQELPRITATGGFEQP